MMSAPVPNVPNKFQERVVRAAEAVLERSRNVGLVELFQELQWISPHDVKCWHQGLGDHRTLERWIHVGPAKFQRAIDCFNGWARARGLRALETPRQRQGPRGIETLQVTVSGDPQWEKLFRTHYVPADLSTGQSEQVAEKLRKAPGLVVFEKVGEEGNCHECQSELGPGSLVFMEKGQPLCLACADLDHLVFLRAGDATLSRRARKQSVLSAVVVKFSRARKRYERQGLLVNAEGLARAEAECRDDAAERWIARERAAAHRVDVDREFVEALTAAIRAQYPGCPPAEAIRIARHTGLRSSGRVGRSAAGRALDPQAIGLAVNAHLRHAHTNYDELLMQGVDRLEARQSVRNRIEEMARSWLKGPQSG